MAKTGCIYGSSGSWKTTAVKHFSHYIAETTGKATLLLSTDGGGWGPCDPEVNAGMIRAYRCDTANIPLPILRKISQGYWPVNTSETDPAKLNLVPINWDEVGGIAVEGLTSISQMLMRYLADKAIKTGEDATNAFRQKVVVNGAVTEEIFAGSSRGHFGFVQNQLYGLVMNFGSLPAKYVLFTAHESKTEDDDRSTIYGPAIAGKKATALVPSWVGDCIHAQDYKVERLTQVPDISDPKKLVESKVIDTVVRAYYKKHPDPDTGILFPCKPRITPEKYQELEKEFPGGFYMPSLTEGFDRYLKVVDKLTAEQGDELKGWRQRMDAKLRPQAVAAPALVK